jgi:lysozyme
MAESADASDAEEDYELMVAEAGNIAASSDTTESSSASGTGEAQATNQQSQTTPASAPPPQQNMSLSQQGLDFIKGYEKFSPTVYDASGKKHTGDWTIGYGHKTTQDAAPVTEAEAEVTLAKDVQGAVNAVNGGLSVSVTQSQFDALVSLAFNAGSRSVASDHQMMQAVNAGNVTEANFTAYRYIHDGDGMPIVSPGLLRRREDEYEMYSEGKY